MTTEFLESPECTGAAGEDCTRLVGAQSNLEWGLRGDADYVTVTLGGRTVTSVDIDIAWWQPNFSLLDLNATGLRVFPEPGDDPADWLRDPANPVTDDFTVELDCNLMDENAIATCESGNAGVNWLDSGTFDLTAVAEEEVDGERVEACSKSIRVVVKRGAVDDPDEQPLDVMLGEHQSMTTSHSSWHQTRDGLPVFPGEDWLFFHRALVRGYQQWRIFFGYPEMQPWDGSTLIPTSESGHTMTDPTRPNQPVLDCVYPGSSVDGSCVPPPWFDITGNGTPRPADAAGAECHTADGEVLPGGQTKLGDFPDAESLGCVMNRTHHAAIHRTIPGSMRWVNESVFDPIFWRYHMWVSGLSVGGQSASRIGATTLAVDGLWSAWESLKAQGSPGVSAVFPPRRRSLSTLDSVLVVFWEPVDGVVAGDLTVNGSPATAVQEDGPWYLFTGFDSPGDGSLLGDDPVEVVVEIAAGAITDAESNPFAGQSWSYTISRDSDGDGVPDDRDNCPMIANLDQHNADSDLVHGEHAHGGHAPSVGSAGDPMGDACDDDDDNDGLSDEFETSAGTDPTDADDPDACPTDPRKYEPGQCGCGVSDVDRDGVGGPECIPPLLLSTTTTLPLAQSCARPLGGAGDPIATDCLFLLRSAVGLSECIPQCVCALRAVYPATATDALICLNAAVGLDVDLLCPCPGV